MKSLRNLSFAVAALIPVALGAQAAQPVASANPVADAFRQRAASAEKNLVAASETMPAEKYGFKPTPAQMSFGDVVAHLAEGNDYFCGVISGTKAPERAKIDSTAGKDKWLPRLKETFAFCDSALAKLDDSKLNEELPFFGGRKVSRAFVMFIASDDWQDHYSQQAIYLRLNGLLPPTAKRTM